jgi:hypothetical protein
VAGAAPADGRLHVTVLDVGQGDAIVVEGPDGRVCWSTPGPADPIGSMPASVSSRRFYGTAASSASQPP